jgi:hypothetical protein
MNLSPDNPLACTYRCSDCGSETGFRSRRRTFTERYLLLFFQPVRCGECFRRDYRWIFTSVRDRLSDPPKMVPGKSPAKQPAPSNRNVA